MLALMFTDAPAATPTTAEKPQLICRQGERETGSHRRTGKRCKTADEWAKEDADRTRLSPSAQITEGQRDSLTKSSPQ
jgi:hypothetical protein